jgi:hypothetical protein
MGMSKAERQLGKTLKTERRAAEDDRRADLPWYMQRNLRAVLTQFFRRRNADNDVIG